MLRRYVHGDAADDPLFWYEGSELTQPRFPHADRKGSIVAIAGLNGSIQAINNYDEYGIPGAFNVGRFQYTGQAWLPELRMYHYKARVYSPTLGRFLQVDPIGYEDQTNLYAYVGNDPLNKNDPTGTFGDIYPTRKWDRKPEKTAPRHHRSEGIINKPSSAQVGAQTTHAVAESQRALAQAGVRSGLSPQSAGARVIRGTGGVAVLGASGITYADQRAKGKSTEDAIANTAGQAGVNVATAWVGGATGAALTGNPLGAFAGAVGLTVVTDLVGITEGAGEQVEGTVKQMRRDKPEWETDCDKCSVPQYK